MVLLGVPDMGKVCAECHVPNFVEKSSGLYEAGVDKIFCVAVATPENAEGWGRKLDLKDSKVVSRLQSLSQPHAGSLMIDSVVFRDSHSVSHPICV